MKKLIIFSILILGTLVANAQFVFKIEPVIFNNRLTNNSFTITGIHAKIIDGTEANLSETFSKTMFLEFQAIRHSDSTTVFIGEQNATSQEIIDKLKLAGMPENTAIATVKSIFKNLEYGTKQEKYMAGATLAAFYNYVILPIEQQE